MNGTTQAKSTVAEEMSEFLADVAQSTISGLVCAVKESAVDLIEGAHGVVASTTHTATASSSPISPLADTGIGAHWLRQLLGRSEWTLPCVGVKLVL
ncbi:hypothetical protein G647_03469 [Cladophialophora carrionii CBS 160.54]|uniref:Uncharacterized protein n=1 Tax=Cladophialophora carrionii CBS 160.54 TaxID=1279043 RepID=V9DB78_9EURO|nr:uncharacterized protein G647_03469 [Cladophialophora carrionii CBS 160.54]ETI24100.1 hypothetical protein G647_03469 [Cladophialophora carrionii CBS 160.54]